MRFAGVRGVVVGHLNNTGYFKSLHYQYKRIWELWGLQCRDKSQSHTIYTVHQNGTGMTSRKSGLKDADLSVRMPNPRETDLCQEGHTGAWGDGSASKGFGTQA